MKLRAPYLVLIATSLTACPSQPSGGNSEGNNQPSPNASILPAPLASGEPTSGARHDAGRVGIPADSAGRLILPEAGPPDPTPWREDDGLPRDTITAKDGTGITLEAQFKWADVPAPPSAPEVNGDGIKKAREKTLLRLSVDLAPVGRMRVSFGSAAFPLPMHAELRAAVDHYGHVLVWPDGNSYRVLRPGVLRALLSERRADALPLTPAKPEPKGKGSYLGLETTKLELKSPVGTLALEQGSVSNVGRSGELLCRLLLDLIAVDPASRACTEGSVPVRAEFSWPHCGKLSFEVSSLTRRPELPFGLLFVPPAGAEFKPGELPPQSSGVLLTRDDLVAFRNKPITGDSPRKDAPGEGLTAVNRTDSLRYVLLDGVPVAWVAPLSEQYLIGPMPGRYSLSWRDFLGTSIEPAKLVSLPARVAIGSEPDAGAQAQ